jgi:hypothetical protein
MSSAADGRPPPLLAAFLSHRYESPEVNLYFQALTAAVATVVFRVDSGKAPDQARVGEATRRPTSTTRLERLIRDADVFVGVWPLPGEPTAGWRHEELAKAARYFRLELDMAARARKPGIVFTDKRYRDVLAPPAGIVQVRYDAQELTFGEAAPGWRKWGRSFATFAAECDRVIPRPSEDPVVEGRVGVLVGDHADLDVTAVVDRLLTDRVLEPVRLPLAMSPAFLRQVRRCDWVVADLSDPAVTVLATFLHGQAVPLLRLRAGAATAAAADGVLYGDLPVGYRKDVVVSDTEDQLRTLLDERLEAVTEEPVYLGDRASAERYFASAAQRDEPVFLSYAGEDEAQAAAVAVRLNRRFRDVFDYRDRERKSLPAGEPWMDTLYGKLSVSAVGVILHSGHYRDSGNCRDEERHLLDRYLQGKLKLLVIRVDDTPIPEQLKSIQYENLRSTDPAKIIDNFVNRLGPAAARPTAT